MDIKSSSFKHQYHISHLISKDCRHSSEYPERGFFHVGVGRAREFEEKFEAQRLQHDNYMKRAEIGVDNRVQKQTDKLTELIMEHRATTMEQQVRVGASLDLARASPPLEFELLAVQARRRAAG